MNAQALIETAQALVANGRGLLAMDESNGTCNQRFASAGIPQTLGACRALLLTTPGLNTGISGVILVDESLRQAGADGTLFVQVARDAGLVVGIKVDTGAMNPASISILGFETDHPHRPVISLWNAAALGSQPAA